MKLPGYVLCILLGMLCLGLSSILVVHDARAQTSLCTQADTAITCSESSTEQIVPSDDVESITINKVNDNDEDVIINHSDTVIDLSGKGTATTIENNGTITRDDYEADANNLAILGGDAEESLTNNGIINGGVNLGGGEDTLTNNGTITGNVYGGSGNDTITNSGTLKGDLNGGDEVEILIQSTDDPDDSEEEERWGDTITNTTSGIIEGNVDGGKGNDEITNNGTIGIVSEEDDGKIIILKESHLYGGEGDDTITNSGTITGNLEGGSVNDTNTNSGNDTITNSGTITGNLNGGDEVEILIQSTDDPDDSEEEEKPGDTILNTTSGIIEGNVDGGKGNDEITNNGTIGIVSEEDDGKIIILKESHLYGGEGDDTITNSGTITGNLEGGAGNDTIILDTGSSIGGIDGGEEGESEDDNGKTGDTLILRGRGTIDHEIKNIETFESQGDWTLDNEDTTFFTFDEATISSGTLTLEDKTTLTAPTVRIEAAGTLAGPGTIMGILTNNGNLSPGNSTGTMTIDGDYDQTSDGTLTIDISPENSKSDLLKITGTADLRGTLAINPLGDIPSLNRYTILTAANITGTLQIFDTGAYFFDVDYSDTQIQVGVTRDFVYNAVTPNQIATGDYINQILATATPDLQEDLITLGLVSGTAYQSALDQIHPEFFDAFTGKTFLENYWFNETLGERRNQCWRNVNGEAPQVESCGLRFATWSQIDGSSIARDGKDTHISYDAEVINMAVGGLWAPANGRDSVQAAIGYSHDSLRITNRGTGSSHRATVGVQGRTYFGPFALVGLLSGGYKWSESSRTITYSTGTRSVNQEATAEFNALIGSADARLEYEAYNSMGIQAVTYAGFGTDHLQTDGFSESYADGLGLEIDGFDVTRYGVFGGGFIKRGISFLSIRRWLSDLSGDRVSLVASERRWPSLSKSFLVPELSMTYMSFLDGFERTLTGRLLGAQSPGTTLAVTGRGPQQRLQLGAWLNTQQSTVLNLSAGVIGSYLDGTETLGGALRLTYRFN